MKQAKIFIGCCLALLFASCVQVINTPGPHGLDGRAYFGVDYDVRPPYSYWDNNPSIPYELYFGEYYRTAPGIYDFEYFINRNEYWYGTYEVFINPGLPGGDYGEPGLDGADTFLMLVCDPDGFYQHFYQGIKQNEDGSYVIEKEEGNAKYRITFQKTNVKERAAQSPKYINEEA